MAIKELRGWRLGSTIIAIFSMFSVFSIHWWSCYTEDNILKIYVVLHIGIYIKDLIKIDITLHIYFLYTELTRIMLTTSEGSRMGFIGQNEF